MCGGDLIEAKLARDVDVERAVAHERDEPFKELWVWLAVERLWFDARCRGRFRLDARGVDRPAAGPQGRHCRIGLWSSGGEQRGVKAVGGESPSAVCDRLGPSVDREIPADANCQRDAVLARCDG